MTMIGSTYPGAFFFSEYIPVMQIRLIFMKDHIKILYSEKHLFT